MTITTSGATAPGFEPVDATVAEATELSVTIIPEADAAGVERMGLIAAARREADEIIAETVEAAEELLTDAERRATQIIGNAELEAARILHDARTAEREIEQRYEAYREAFVAVAEAVGAMHIIAARE